MRKVLKNSQDIYIVNSKTKQLEIPSTQGLNAYTTSIYFPSSKIYKKEGIGFIDTGASNTAITMKALYNLMNINIKDIIIGAAQRSKSTKRSFSSANGTNDVIGYYCILPSIKISDMIIKDFPFYLVDNTEKALILLGYDFISSCDIVQIRNAPLAFYNFDIKSMYKKMCGVNPLKLMYLV